MIPVLLVVIDIELITLNYRAITFVPEVAAADDPSEAEAAQMQQPSIPHSAESSALIETCTPTVKKTRKVHL